MQGGLTSARSLTQDCVQQPAVMLRACVVQRAQAALFTPVIGQRRPPCTRYTPLNPRCIRSATTCSVQHADDAEQLSCQATSGRPLFLSVPLSVAAAITPDPAAAEGLLPDVQGLDQIVVGILFGIAVAALSVLTAGVAYLSITQWLDARTENDDRKKFSQQSKDKEYDTAMKAFAEPNKVVKAKKKVKASKKGFR